MQKRMFIFAIIIALIAAIATAYLRGDIGNGENNKTNHTDELYAMKDTNITDKVAVGRVVKQANLTEYEISGINIWNDAGDDRIDVKFKVDDRSKYRYADYTGLNKTAVLVFSLIPDADAIAFYFFDDYGDAENLETSFNGSYYDRNFVYERNGMDKFHIEYIDGATNSADAFGEYYDAVKSIVGKDTKTDLQEQMYAFIGDDCEIVVNSGMGADIPLDDAFFDGEDYTHLKSIFGETLGKYAGAGKTMHLAKYDVRNFKTGETEKCTFAYYEEPEIGVVMIGQKILTDDEAKIIREQIIKRY